MITDSTQVIYARVPSGLKEHVEVYAAEHGLTLTSAVAELLERGLEAVSNGTSIKELEARVASLDRESSAARIEAAEAKGEASALRARDNDLLTLAQRAEMTVGPCPHCKSPVRGSDVLLTQRCGTCGRGLSSVLVGPQMKGLDQTELLVLLGALGIIVGAAYLGSKGGK